MIVINLTTSEWWAEIAGNWGDAIKSHRDKEFCARMAWRYARRSVGDLSP